jgi:hypothetical protein
MAARKQQDWAPAFLKALEDTHLVTEACKAAGIHRSAAYNRRAHDAEFARAWAEIEEASTEQLERIAVRRASEGSDVLLIFLLKARRPEVYRDHHRVEQTGPGAGALDVEFRLDAAARAAIAGVLRQRPAAC